MLSSGSMRQPLLEDEHKEDIDLELGEYRHLASQNSLTTLSTPVAKYLLTFLNKKDRSYLSRTSTSYHHMCSSPSMSLIGDYNFKLDQYLDNFEPYAKNQKRQNFKKAGRIICSISSLLFLITAIIELYKAVTLGYQNDDARNVMGNTLFEWMPTVQQPCSLILMAAESPLSCYEPNIQYYSKYPLICAELCREINDRVDIIIKADAISATSFVLGLISFIGTCCLTSKNSEKYKFAEHYEIENISEELVAHTTQLLISLNIEFEANTVGKLTVREVISKLKNVSETHFQSLGNYLGR